MKKGRSHDEKVELLPSSAAAAAADPGLDLHRTGAKCLPCGGIQDAHGPGLAYHTALGAIRTKPGRGHPTRSLSCSDKILKWSYLGIQGSILAGMMSGPVPLSSVTVAAGVVSCGDFKEKKAALERALVGRLQVIENRKTPKVFWVEDSNWPFRLGALDK